MTAFDIDRDLGKAQWQSGAGPNVTAGAGWLIHATDGMCYLVAGPSMQACREERVIQRFDPYQATDVLRDQNVTTPPQHAAPPVAKPMPPMRNLIPPRPKTTRIFREPPQVMLGDAHQFVTVKSYDTYARIEGFEVPVIDANGHLAHGDILDVRDLSQDDCETPVTVRNVKLADDGHGNAALSFPGGEGVILVGVDPHRLTDARLLVAMGIPESVEPAPSEDDEPEDMSPYEEGSHNEMRTQLAQLMQMTG